MLNLCAYVRVQNWYRRRKVITGR